MRFSVRSIVTCSALALALAACTKSGSDSNTTDTAAPALPATLPMTTGAATNPALAPTASALPSRRIATARLADPRQAYAYADQAADYADALEGAPPDYGFGYDGVEPWAWQDGNGERVFAEPIDDGYRYYYYRPGADTPYFVRDPHYGYGYDGSSLAVIYTAAGAILPYADYGPRLGYGGAYWGRGRDLYRASLGADRRAIIAANWAARANAIARSRADWVAARERQADWRAYHAAQGPRDQDYLARVEARRQADAQRFADWRRDDFRGNPPPRVIPARWQDAGWAQNRAAYAPINPGPRPDRGTAGQPGDARFAGQARERQPVGGPGGPGGNPPADRAAFAPHGRQIQAAPPAGPDQPAGPGPATQHGAAPPDHTRRGDDGREPHVPQTAPRPNGWQSRPDRGAGPQRAEPARSAPAEGQMRGTATGQPGPAQRAAAPHAQEQPRQVAPHQQPRAAPQQHAPVQQRADARHSDAPPHANPAPQSHAAPQPHAGPAGQPGGGPAPGGGSREHH